MDKDKKVKDRCEKCVPKPRNTKLFVRCNLCLLKQHATCADAPQEMASAQHEAENQAMWFCKNCSEIVINQIIGYQKFETQTKVLTNSIDELRNVKAEMENLVKQTKDLRNSIDELRGVKAEMDNLQKKNR